jgi:tetratricopeptide (TPR) repeat protein
LLCSTITNNLGIVHWIKGNLDLALDCFFKSYNLKKNFNFPLDNAMYLNNIGMIYADRGELDTAFEYYNKSLALQEGLGKSDDLALTLNNIGILYYDKDEVDISLDYHTRALELWSESDNPLNISESYIEIIKCLLVKNELEISSEYLLKFKELNDSNDNKYVYLKYHLAQAIYLKSSMRMKDKVLAQTILTELVEINDFSFERLIESLNHLIELLIYEYQVNSLPEVYDEITEYITKMSEIASKQNMFAVIIGSLILQAKLKCVENKYEEGMKFFDEAINFCKERNLNEYQIKINKEKEELINNITELRNFTSDNLAERLEKAQILEYITYMRQFAQKRK